MSAELDSKPPLAVAEIPEEEVSGIAPSSLHGPWRGTARHRWGVWAVIVLGGVLALAVDVPLSRAMVEDHALQRLHNSLGSIEPFGQPAVVIAVSLGILLCGGSRRGEGFRIVSCALVAGIVTDLLKLCVARVRPRAFDFQGTVFDTFHGIFPGATEARSLVQSWPSGHTTVAVAFFLALSTIFPQGRWLFGVLAALVALQRIEAGAHYLSDTLFAASVAYAVAAVVFGPGPVGAWFDRLTAWSATFRK
jgi:membrane-associated phospholipid phosphatase